MQYSSPNLPQIFFHAAISKGSVLNSSYVDNTIKISGYIKKDENGPLLGRKRGFCVLKSHCQTLM